MDNGASSYRRFLDGDKEAFREIIDLYRLNLIFFVNGLIHNLSDSEDIVEDSLLTWSLICTDTTFRYC